MPSNPRKRVILIIDGLGDRSVAELGHRTPLEAAHTPILDRLASAGEVGLVDPIAPNIIPNTHSGVALLMGCDPGQASQLRRGPIEVAGAGYSLGPDEIAMRANFASIESSDGGFYVRDRRAGRISDGTQALARILQDLDLGDGVRASLISTDDHRGVLLLAGPGLSANISDTDPGDHAMPTRIAQCRPLDGLGDGPGGGTAGLAALFTAEKVNAFVALAYQKLKDHPVNTGRELNGLPPASGVITRSAGGHLTLDNLIVRAGFSAAVVTGCNTVEGLARLFGFSVSNDPSFTGTADTNLAGKLDAVIEALQSNDIVYLHIKATDIFAHDRQAAAKRDFLEVLDQVLDPLTRLGAVLALTADHTTDSNTGMHTADPVPSLIFTPVTTIDSADIEFGESACADGGMPRQSSHEFLLRILRDQ